MSKEERLPSADKRTRYMDYRTSILLADKEMPTPADTNKLLDPLVQDGPHYLPFAYAGKPQDWKIPTFPEWDHPIATLCEARMTVDGTQDAIAYEFSQVTPLNPPPPIPMTLHLATKDNPGLRKISYTWIFGGNAAPTVGTFEYMVDFAKPVLNTKIVVPQSVIDAGIGPEDFENGKTITLTYPDYSNKRLGDTLKCFIGQDKFVKAEVGSITFDEGNIGTPITFELTAAHVGNRNGNYIFFCEAVSYPGVAADSSDETPVFISRDLRPVVAEPLDVPQIQDENTDTLEVNQLVDGVTAGLKNLIPNFNTALDRMVISIDGIDQKEEPIAGFPFQHKLLNTSLLLQGEGKRQVELGYRIKRGDYYFPKTPITRRVWLDVRKPAAPFDPNNPDPPDMTLQKPWIQGPVSTDRNVLTAADKQSNQPVDGFLPYHTRFKKGDTAQFLINSHPAPRPNGVWVYPLTGPAPDPAVPISFKFDWIWLMDTVGNDPSAQLTVLVTHDLNANEAMSPHDNADIDITPITLGQAGLLHMDPNPLVGFICKSLRSLPSGEVVGVVHIPGDTRLEGNEVSLQYGGYPTPAGIDTDLIHGTFFEKKYKPDAAEAASGFDLYVPYAFLLRTLNAYARVDYYVTIKDEFVPTKGAVVRLNMSFGGGTCDISNPIPV